MKNKGNHDTETLIRLEAYLLSERAGHPAGMDAIFWKQAEAIVHEGKSLSKQKDGKPVKKKTVSKKALAKVEAKQAAADKLPPGKPTVTKTVRKSKAKGGADHNKLDA